LKKKGKRPKKENKDKRDLLNLQKNPKRINSNILK